MSPPDGALCSKNKLQTTNAYLSHYKRQPSTWSMEKAQLPKVCSNQICYKCWIFDSPFLPLEPVHVGHVLASELSLQRCLVPSDLFNPFHSATEQMLNLKHLP